MQLVSSPLVHTEKNFKGFTLIELIVSVAVFMVVLIIATGALYSAQSLNARLQSTHVILDGMNLSFDLMSRDIRYGSIFYCSSDGDFHNNLSSVRQRKSCPLDLTDLQAGGTGIVFKPVDAVNDNDRIGYHLVNGKIYQWNYNGLTFAETEKQITSDDVTINSLHFFVSGANTSPTAQANGNTENAGGVTDITEPVITAVVSGSIYTSASASAEKIDFQLETTISSRGLDL